LIVVGLIAVVILANWLFDAVWENTVGRVFSSLFRPKPSADFDRFKRGTGGDPRA
jgi:hypothetical protein